MDSYSLSQIVEKPVSILVAPAEDGGGGGGGPSTYDDIYDSISSCTHPPEAFDELNFFCNDCGMAFKPGFSSLSCSSNIAQGFFCHSYVSSINKRFGRSAKKTPEMTGDSTDVVKKRRTTPATARKSKSAGVETAGGEEEEIPKISLAELIKVHHGEIMSEYSSNSGIPYIDVKIPKIERSKSTKGPKDLELIVCILKDCFGSSSDGGGGCLCSPSTFENLLNGYAVYNTGKKKLAEPCPLSRSAFDSRRDIVNNWDVFMSKVSYIFKEYSEINVVMSQSLNKRNRSKAHVELYVVLLIYHILQFHLETDPTTGAFDINVPTLNDCFDLNRITVTKMRPSNPKSKLKTVICGLSDRLGVGNSTIPRLIVESISFSLKFIKSPRFDVYRKLGDVVNIPVA